MCAVRDRIPRSGYVFSKIRYIFRPLERTVVKCPTTTDVIDRVNDTVSCIYVRRTHVIIIFYIMIHCLLNVGPRDRKISRVVYKTCVKKTVKLTGHEMKTPEKHSRSRFGDGV